jgi:TonB-dependent starch-binding outer membrane protein SusC
MLLAIMRKSVMLLLAVIGFTAFAAAQTVTGTVTDSKGDPISGASVTVKGTTKGTSTNAQGVFTLNGVEDGATLIFTGTGFASQQAKVKGGVANASLATSVSNLNEVVVVGYGTRKVKDATGSVAALSTKDFNKGVISTPEQLFQGRTPGVTVTPSSGEPGAASTINIRGTSSIRGNNDPLYVVDGVPLDGGGTSATASGIEGNSTPKNPLLFLNPNDIESISILKDASSAAIYGSRGANGVIIITTKNGKGNKGAFSFGSTTSISKTASRYDLLSTNDFIRGVIRENIASGTTPADAAAAALLIDKGYSTNWQNEIFRTGVSQNYNLGWGFSRKSTSLRLSGSIDDQKGIIKKSGLQRVTGRANFTQKFLENDRLRFDATLTYSNVKNQYVPNTNNAGYQGSLIGAVITFNPTFPIKNPDGSYYDPGDGNRNPVQMLNYFDDKDNIDRVLTNISGSYRIIEGLTYKATIGYDNSKSLRKSFADPRLGSSAFGGTTNVFGVDYKNGIFGNGRAVYQDLKLTSTLFENTLTYDKTFKNGHNINAVAGYSYQSSKVNSSGRVGFGLTTPVVNPKDEFIKDIENFKYDSIAYLPSSTKTELQSFFGRVNYSINDKYLFTATLRIDGSSKFGTDNRYGTFPAFAAKWKILNENFAANSLGKVFNDLSIRANYGILGSQDGLSPYSARGQLINYNGVTQNVLVQNKKLKWEEATTTGIGIDFGLKNNRLSGTVDYYSTQRKNIIYEGPTPGGYSASSRYFSNLPGIVVNTGLEVSLNYQIIKSKRFKWDVNYNMTFLTNKLKDFGVPLNTGVVNGQGLTGAYAQTIADGYSLFTWKMPVFEGYDKNGFAIYANGSSDKLLGSALPTFTAGLTNNFSFGRWNASVFMNTSRGFYVYNNTANALFLAGSLKTAHNVTYDVYNSGESPINPGSVSTRFLEKGDFIRLSNAILSYNFDIKNKFIKSLSASISGQNLALWTDYSGLDPEVNVDKNINGVPSRGFDYAGYPRARTFSLGLNLGF